jgi:AcrR family transcriptional regulator
VFRLPVTHLERPLTYSSPAIQARRKRILDVAFELVAEVGISGFSMDDVGKRANVAKRTLYNAFQTRERMIAVAIGSQFNRFLKRIVYSSPEGTMRHNLERLVSVSERDRKMPHYIAAIMAIYFSHDADEDIRSTLHDMGVAPNLIWIESLHQRGELQPWIDPAKLADDVMAETEGFEPSVPDLPVRRFSKPLVSATHPRLRIAAAGGGYSGVLRRVQSGSWGEFSLAFAQTGANSTRLGATGISGTSTLIQTGFNQTGRCLPILIACWRMPC